MLPIENFLDEVRSRLEARGFTFLTSSHIDTADGFPYHVDWYEEVRDKTMYFLAPYNKAIVIEVGSTEQQYAKSHFDASTSTGYHRYFGLRIDVDFPNLPAWRQWDSAVEVPERMDGSISYRPDRSPQVAGMPHRGWSSKGYGPPTHCTWNMEGQIESSATFADDLLNVSEQLAEFCNPAPVQKIQVTSWKEEQLGSGDLQRIGGSHG